MHHCTSVRKQRLGHRDKQVCFSVLQQESISWNMETRKHASMHTHQRESIGTQRNTCMRQCTSASEHLLGHRGTRVCVNLHEQESIPGSTEASKCVGHASKSENLLRHRDRQIRASMAELRLGWRGKHPKWTHALTFRQSCTS